MNLFGKMKKVESFTFYIRFFRRYLYDDRFIEYVSLFESRRLAEIGITVFVFAELASHFLLILDQEGIGSRSRINLSLRTSIKPYAFQRIVDTNISHELRDLLKGLSRHCRQLLAKFANVDKDLIYKDLFF